MARSTEAGAGSRLGDPVGDSSHSGEYAKTVIATCGTLCKDADQRVAAADVGHQGRARFAVTRTADAGVSVGGAHHARVYFQVITTITICVG